MLKCTLIENKDVFVHKANTNAPFFLKPPVFITWLPNKLEYFHEFNIINRKNWNCWRNTNNCTLSHPISTNRVSSLPATKSSVYAYYHQVFSFLHQFKNLKVFWYGEPLSKESCMALASASSISKFEIVLSSVLHFVSSRELCNSSKTYPSLIQGTYCIAWRVFESSPRFLDSPFTSFRQNENNNDNLQWTSMLHYVFSYVIVKIKFRYK